jgi:hypothetical protein
MKESCKVAVRQDGSGKYSVAVLIDGLELKRRKNGRLYELADYEGPAPVDITLNGVKIRPKMIFKLFKKVSRNKAMMIEATNVDEVLKLPFKQII